MNPEPTYLSALLAALPAGLGAIVPELVLVGGLVLGLLVEIGWGGRKRLATPGVVMASIGLYIVALVMWWPAAGVTHFAGMIAVDGFAAYVKLLVAVASLLALAAAADSTRLRIHSKGTGEYFLVALGMVTGMAFMAMARNLLMMYVALEMVSLPAYALTAYARMKQKSAEAALKYVIYGCFASGLMLYGISWLYGFTGTLDPSAPEFGAGLLAAGTWPVTMMLALVLGGFAFKIGALPYHFWMPDVMEGAPHPVASLLAVAPKVAGLGMLLRWMAQLRHSAGAALSFAPAWWEHLGWLLAIVAMGSMLLGNLAALRQSNLRRLLGYSAIAQAGYLLAGALLPDGHGVVLFYLTIYLFMNMAAFLIAGWLEEAAGITKLQELKGMAARLPLLAGLTTVAMVSLTGLPPTAGFIAKLRLFLGGIAAYQENHSTLLLVVMVMVLVNTVISLFYYLRVGSTMVFGNPVIKNWPAFRGFVPVLIVIITVPLIWLGIISFDALINFLQTLAPFANG